MIFACPGRTDHHRKHDGGATCKPKTWARRTRAQAIADGFLVDVTPLAAEAGIRYPAAVTRALWKRHIEPPPGLPGQDATGRMGDVLTIFRLAARQRGASVLRFRVLFAERDGQLPVAREVKCVCGPGDDAAPVLTFMLPDED